MRSIVGLTVPQVVFRTFSYGDTHGRVELGRKRLFHPLRPCPEGDRTVLLRL